MSHYNKPYRGTSWKIVFQRYGRAFTIGIVSEYLIRSMYIQYRTI